MTTTCVHSFKCTNFAADHVDDDARGENENVIVLFALSINNLLSSYARDPSMQFSPKHRASVQMLVH